MSSHVLSYGITMSKLYLQHFFLFWSSWHIKFRFHEWELVRPSNIVCASYISISMPNFMCLFHKYYNRNLLLDKNSPWVVPKVKDFLLFSSWKIFQYEKKVKDSIILYTACRSSLNAADYIIGTFRLMIKVIFASTEYLIFAYT